MEALILLQFAGAVILNICIAIALYHMGERRFANGTTWAIIGLFFGILGLLFFFFYMLWSEGMTRMKEQGESQRISRFLSSQQQESRSQHKLVHSSDVDHYFDELMANSRLDLAEQHVMEKLRQAHEQGDKNKEAVCREQLELVTSRRMADWHEEPGR